jgi:cation diffusion facilitator family transporter
MLDRAGTAVDGGRSEEAHAAETRALRLALAMYTTVFAVKFVVYFVTGVMALFAEALHTLGDIFVTGFLLVALRWSRKAPDEVHMFGYARVQPAAALVAATLFISFTAFQLYQEAIPRLFSSEVSSYDAVGLAYAVLTVSALLAAAPLVALVRNPKRGAAAKAQMWELVNDELGLIAALVGMSLAIAGFAQADPLAAVIIATIISWKAISLLRENMSLVIGRAPDPDMLATIKDIALATPGVVGIHDLRAELVGTETIHLGLHIEVAGNTSRGRRPHRRRSPNAHTQPSRWRLLRNPYRAHSRHRAPTRGRAMTPAGFSASELLALVLTTRSAHRADAAPGER